MYEFQIENLEAQNIKAEVVDGGKQYTTYINFAEQAGYPRAVGFTDPRSGVADARSLEGVVVKVLAKGKHEYINDTLYVCEAYDGKQFLIGEEGVRIMSATIPTLANATMDELIEEIKRRSFESGYTAAVEEESRVQDCNLASREDIVNDAKKDVEEMIERGGNEFTLGGVEGNDTYRRMFYRVEFVVNRDKRTVVALVRQGRFGAEKVAHRGIAKCDPADCFNEHIGKAIALRRAFDLPVPESYLNAPHE